MPYFKYQSRNVFYNEIGEGNPLLLLHGNTASSKMFSNVMDGYISRYKVILIDFLGHGRSERLEKFPADLWFEEALQVIAFLEEKQYRDVFLLGSSGGALVAINAALERPDLISRIVADSFEGEKALDAFTENIVNDRERSKQDPGARTFYQAMHGDDWESVVDNDTVAIAAHSKTIGWFFHKPLSELHADILLTGSLEDEFITSVDGDFFQKTYGKMLKEIGHGESHLFRHGGHPAILSNPAEFAEKTFDFLSKN